MAAATATNDETCARLNLERVQQLLAWETDILAQAVEAETLQPVLDRLCQLAERMVPNAVASIMLLNDRDTLDIAAAPSVPEEARAALCNLKPGPQSGSCGNVVYSGQPQVVTSTLTDTRWLDLKDLAVRFQLGACWSYPVHDETGRVIGTFALSSFEPRRPSAFHLQVLEVGARLAGLVLRMLRTHERLRHLATHNPLTRLPNGHKLRADLRRFMDEGRSFVCVYLDIERFREVNETYGHACGDELLRLVAARLKSCSETLAALPYHFNGDQFVLVVFDCDCAQADFREKMSQRCDWLSRQLRGGIEVCGHYFHLNVVIGLACSAQAGRDVSQLLSMANMALDAAKHHRGERSWRFFTEEMARSLEENRQLENMLHQALREAALDVFYQPVLDAQGRVVSLEALVRWPHPEQGMISPARFIPVAERAGLIGQLDQFVLKTVCRDLLDWQAQGVALDFSVAVNVSALEFTEEQVTALIEILKDCAAAEHIEIEITETALVQDADTTSALLQRFRDAGVRAIALDDFGTGYSSLSYLSRFRLDKLKIDQSLVRHVDVRPTDAAIVRAICALARALDLTVVAEGIETDAHRDRLRREGVELMQGYLFARPMPAEAIPQWLADHRRS